MCDPVSLGVASLVVGTVGAYSQAKAQKQAAKAESQIAANNAIIADRQAADALDRGKASELNYRRNLEQLKGQQRSAFSASGVQVDQGSAIDILGDTAAFGELDALNIRADAEREAYGYKVQSSNFSTQSSLSRNEAKGINPLFSAGSTALTAGSSLATQFGSFSGGTSTPAGYGTRGTTVQGLPWLK